MISKAAEEFRAAVTRALLACARAEQTAILLEEDRALASELDDDANWNEGDQKLATLRNSAFEARTAVLFAYNRVPYRERPADIEQIVRDLKNVGVQRSFAPRGGVIVHLARLLGHVLEDRNVLTKDGIDRAVSSLDHALNVETGGVPLSHDPSDMLRCARLSVVFERWLETPLSDGLGPDASGDFGAAY